MPPLKRSLTVQVIAALVVSTTFILSVYAVVRSHLHRSQETAALDARLAVTAEQLQTAAASALWNFDLNQLDRVLDGGMKDTTLTGIVVKSGGKVYARTRNDDWEPVSREPAANTAGHISHTEDIVYAGHALGTMTLSATTRFMNDRLKSDNYALAANILLMDLVLIASLYLLLNRIILRPLRTLETCAVSVCNGDKEGADLGRFSFSGEMEVLRSSMENMVTLLESRYAELQQEARRFSESENRFRSLMDTIPDLIWLKDADGVYLSCNRPFERLYGAREADIVGKTDYDFVDKELADFFREHDRKAAAAGGPSSNEEWVTFADTGQRALLYTTKIPMYDDGGVLIGILGVGRDIGEIRRGEEERAKLEGQLHQAQRIESVGRLAGGVAHDFNNMLSVILGYTSLALREVDPDRPLHAKLEEICKAAEHSADLTRQLLAFARKQTICPKVVDLNETVGGMLNMLQRLIGEEIQLTWRPAADLRPVKADPSQIDQILANLCVNARDSISGMGTIDIATKNCVIDEHYCAHNPDAAPGEYVAITVLDSGCGMDKETLEHIFEPFFTTKGVGEGTGLGLATVYGAVKQNGGFVTVYSEPGMGTKFTIHLPRHVGEAGQAPQDAVEAELPGGRETILLVEDEPAILEMAAMILSSLGYTVLQANLPGEAIRVAGESGGEIHLLMTDVVMPEMNGRDLAQSLQTLHPHLRCLFTSGYTADVIAPHGVLDPGVHFIQKPFTLSDLAVKVREALDG
ncbi:PAS domain-containing sensor histidine kinase [Geobacter sp. AOG2]|uniref:hybrid sensor histidine kinase/response regulator n=1 Tax=Geobacter sp. AOG2 TaxID=1566347 RepID=UPI001CC6BF2E|nr:PAS domain-containing sensor histidine kinase [Geobacter sp. AOG2]GFE62901.1 hypothetical protein AOG2_34900 [Geobacter sp. AOG2]